MGGGRVIIPMFARSKCFRMLEKCEPPPEQWIFMWLGTLQRGVTCTLQLTVSKAGGNTGTASQLWVVVFYQGDRGDAVEHDESPMRDFIRANGEMQWSMMSQPWGFLSGRMVNCSGAWVNHEGFYQGEWWNAVEHDESTMRGFIRVNGEMQWSMMSQPWGFLSGWMRCSGSWWVTHECFYQGEWGAVEHDELPMRVIRVNEVQWSMTSHTWRFLLGWMARSSEAWWANHEIFIWVNGDVQWSRMK